MHVVGVEFVIVAIALFAGAVVQGSLGFGMVLVMFPVLVITEPELLPQTTLIVALPMMVGLAWRHRGGAVWREVGLVTLGRLPGIAVAITILTIASPRAIGLMAGATVLGAVALSFWAPAVPRTTPNLLMAGAVSAVFGTSVSIGGPPLALLFQHEKGPQLRSTMTSIMLFGAPMSLLFLTISGKVDNTDVRTGLALAPFSIAGSYSSRWAIPYVDDRLRPIILSVCAFGAIVAMARLAMTG
jgi:uncharacterized membrane protein YfcA